MKEIRLLRSSSTSKNTAALTWFTVNVFISIPWGKPLESILVETSTLRAFLPFGFIPQPTVFMRKSVLDRVGLVDTDLHFAMDLDLWVRIAMGGRVDFIPEILARYRLHDGTKTVSSREAFEREGIESKSAI